MHGRNEDDRPNELLRLVFQARNHNLPQEDNSTYSTAERHGTMGIYIQGLIV